MTDASQRLRYVPGQHLRIALDTNHEPGRCQGSGAFSNARVERIREERPGDEQGVGYAKGEGGHQSQESK